MSSQQEMPLEEDVTEYETDNGRVYIYSGKRKKQK
jgi:hypothetical protein